MIPMAVNKIVIGTTTKLDISSDTVTAADVKDGVTFHTAAGTAATGSAPTQAAQTYLPTSTVQTIIPAGTFVTGDQKISGAGNFKAANIKYGVAMWGVTGTYGITTPIVAGQTPIILNASVYRSSATAMTDTGISITIPAAGTYRIKWVAFRSNTSSSYTWATQLTKNGTLIGDAVTSWTQSYMQINQLEVACAANDVISISARGRGGSYYVFTGHLAACVTATFF